MSEDQCCDNPDILLWDRRLPACDCDCHTWECDEDDSDEFRGRW